MARRPKVEEVQDKVVEAMRLGMTYALAADYVGVSVATLYRWMKVGREDERSPYREFFDAVKRAQAHNVANHLATITKAAQDGRWQASAWILERRHGWWASRDQSAEDEAALSDIIDDRPQTVEDLLRDLRKLPPELLRRALIAPEEDAA